MRMLMRRRRQAPFHTEGQTFGEPIDTLRSGLAHEYRRPQARQRPLSKVKSMAGPHYLFAFLTSFVTFLAVFLLSLPPPWLLRRSLTLWSLFLA